MKYAILFATVTVILTSLAIGYGGWLYILFWPALSFAIIALGYFYLGPCVYGKSHRGRLSPINQLILLPYLLYLWLVWHILRLIRREAAFNQLTENVFIGRRLLSHEFPANIDHVIDLTCEFTEPKALRSTSYYSFQILDGCVPSCNQLRDWVAKTADLSGNIYIHCAEGHGRTGIFAAALLLHTGYAKTPDKALQLLKSKRPLIHLGQQQIAMLNAIYNKT